MNFPGKTTLVAGVAVLGLSACAQVQEGSRNQANQIVDGFLGENIATGDMAYREGTPVPNTDNVCDMIQPIFDPTTGEAMAIIDPNLVQAAEDNGDELIVLCHEGDTNTDAMFNLGDEKASS